MFTVTGDPLFHPADQAIGQIMTTGPVGSMIALARALSRLVKSYLRTRQDIV
jgi:hypothetical protein